MVNHLLLAKRKFKTWGRVRNKLYFELHICTRLRMTRYKKSFKVFEVGISEKFLREESHVHLWNSIFTYGNLHCMMILCQTNLLVSNFKFLFSPSFVLNRSFVLLFFFLLCVLLSHCLGLLLKLLSLEPGDRGGGKKLWIMILQIPDHPCDNAQITVVLREKNLSYP